MEKSSSPIGMLCRFDEKKFDKNIRYYVFFVFLLIKILILGIQTFYLTWGVLQEKIMTRQYVDSAGNIGQFKDSQFLVFVNRILAFAVALLYISTTKQPRHKAPIYKYSYCSFSNIMSR